MGAVTKGFPIRTPAPLRRTSKSLTSHNHDGPASKTSTPKFSFRSLFQDKKPDSSNKRHLPPIAQSVDNNEFSLKNFDKTFFHPSPGFYKISIDYEQNAANS